MRYFNIGLLFDVEESRISIMREMTVNNIMREIQDVISIASETGNNITVSLYNHFASNQLALDIIDNIRLN